MANGHVIIGYSFPHVATYVNTNGTISYTGCIPLARGIRVDIQPSNSDRNVLRADNADAESSGGRFSGGTATLGVDGLKSAARTLIMGTPAAGNDGWIAEGDTVDPPYVGVGFVVKYREEGVDTYQPVVLAKVKFDTESVKAETEGETVSYQTQDLTAQIFRDDSASHIWRYRGAEVNTEAAAVSALVTKLGG